MRDLSSGKFIIAMLAMAQSGCVVHRTGLRDLGASTLSSARDLDSYSECVKKHPATPNACGGRDPENGPISEREPEPQSSPRTPRRPPKPPPTPLSEPLCRLMGQGGGSTWSKPKKCFYECPPGARPQICKYVRGYQVPCPDGPRGEDIAFSEIKDLDDCD